MQEIKYRAWDTKEKRYLLYASYLILNWNNGKVFDRTIGDYTDRYIFEQFTGKQDKNGKNIYEDDICKITRFENQFIIGKIYFGSGSYCITDGVAICSTNELSHIKSNIIEIIGNIHQNKELLEGKS